MNEEADEQGSQRIGARVPIPPIVFKLVVDELFAASCCR